MHKSIPQYHTLQGVLDRLDTEVNPAEVHGTLCGLLCVRTGARSREWQDSLWPDRDTADVLVSEAMDMLSVMHNITREQLNDPECDFQLLMPDDEENIDVRIRALSEWCQGFLAGLALGGVKELSELPEDAGEIANDLVEIARAETAYHLEGSEEDEQAYAELLEYLRVGVLLIHEELQPLQATSPVNTTTH